MTNALHMDIDVVSSCALHFRAESGEIRQRAQTLAVSARSVDWYGPSRDVFQYELEQIAIALTRLADEGDVLASKVQRDSNEWQEIDSHYSQHFSQVIITNLKKG